MTVQGVLILKTSMSDPRFRVYAPSRDKGANAPPSQGSVPKVLSYEQTVILEPFELPLI